MRECLISICGIGQLGANPSFCDFFVCVYSVLYVRGAFCQRSVGFFDSLHSLVGPIDCVAAQLGEFVTRYRIVIAVLSSGPGGEWGEQAEHER